MGFPSDSLLLVLSLVLNCSWASITPGVAEVDLIFPRNESFPPSSLTPIIFAIQNPSLLSSVYPQIRYSIEEVNVNSSERVSISGSLDLAKLNYTRSDPYFLYWSTSKFDIEGTFKINWALDIYNCSHEPDSTDLTLGYLGARGRRSFFSTKNGTSQPDFAAATEDGTCEASLAQAIHVQDFLNVPSGQVWGSPTRTQNWYAPKQPTWRGSSCAVTADWVPTPSPCNVKIGSSAATSISAALTSTACANPLRTGLNCPTPSPQNAASVAQLPVGRLWTLAIGMLLAYAHAWS